MPTPQESRIWISEIFKQMLSLIDQAQTTVVLDMFLFNKEVGTQNRPSGADAASWPMP